jgi:predicted amidohydrolase
MKIVLVQFDIVWENRDSNLKRIEALLSDLPAGTDLIILPEMFNTGFSMNPAELSERPGSVTFKWMEEMAKRFDSAICGSYIVEESGRYYNRWIFVSERNEVVVYDKRHLFSPGGENRLFTAGHERVVFSYRGLRILPTVCYDLRFPVWLRNRNDYDLMINSSNWPAPRQDVWNTLLRARAIENQCYVAGVNRLGTDGEGIRYEGESAIVGPKCEILARGTADTSSLICSEISAEELSSFREKFPVLNDADDFVINI